MANKQSRVLQRFKKIPKRKTSNYVPGTVRYKGKKEKAESVIDIIDYSKSDIKIYKPESLESAFQHKGTETVSWINIDGLSNTETIEKLGGHFGLHPLIQEDIVDTAQRPKMDEYDEYLFIVFKMLYYNDNAEMVYEHVSMVVGQDYVLTFQEADGDVFDSLRDRITNDKGRVRNSGSDYLMFAILDAVVDNYFTVIETLSDKIEFIEDQLFELNSEGVDLSKDILHLKKEVLKIRKAVSPLREVINRLEKTDIDLIDPKTHNYIRDLYDHIIQISENIDLYREMTWGLMDMHMTNISNRMNEIMKVLTIMASIFIPLTFLAGIYGMNFEYIPELKFKYGYFVLLGIMFVVLVIMIWYFRRKHWIK